MHPVFRETFIHVGTYAELDPTQRSLVDAAFGVRGHAQAPYSKYHVGAAGLFANGKVFTGVNVEAGSWTQTTHAEQSVIAQAVASCGPVKLVAMAIVGAAASAELKLPPIVGDKRIQSVHDICPSCGHCLQIMWEQCDGDRSVQLIQLHWNGEVAVTTMGDAFPMAFGPKDLGIDVFAERS